MADEIAKTVEAASAAVKGPDTPDSVKITNREDDFSLWMRNLAGPAISGLVILVIAILSFGTKMPWVGPLWTAVSEIVRVHYVGAIGIACALMLGVLIWRLDGSKLGRLEVKMGPGSLTMGEDDKE